METGSPEHFKNPTSFLSLVTQY